MLPTTLDKISTLETWQTSADASLGTLLQQSSAAVTRIEEMASRVTQLELQPPPPPSHWSMLQPAPAAAAGLDLNAAPGASSSATPPRANSPMGHIDEHQNRDAGGGLLGAPPPRPGNGTMHVPVPQPVPHIPPVHQSEMNPRIITHHFLKWSFPNSMDLTPSVVGSMQTLFRGVCDPSFDEDMIRRTQFQGGRGDMVADKDQYQILLRQLDSLKQSASVLEYQAEFEKLAHGVLLYNPAIDDTFFVTRFVGGLREDIRSVILLHHPPDVDTASALALIQEQDIGSVRAKSSGREFTRGTKVPDQTKPAYKEQKAEADDKLASLKSFRHRNGLCFKCGKKWSPAHKCPPHVSLHVLEEILDALDTVECNEDLDSEEEAVSDEQEVLAVQSTPVHQKAHKQTLKLLAQIGKHQVLILVDSGSVGTFVSQQLVQHLKLSTTSCEPSPFRAADGGIMLCDQVS